MIIRRIIVSICLMLMPALLMSASTVGVFDLKGIVGPGQKKNISEHIVVTGVVISDFRNPNMAVNGQLSYNIVDVGKSRRTAFLQDSDGKSGVRLSFVSEYDNELSFGDKVAVDLAGTIITHFSDPDYIVIDNLKATNVLNAESGDAPQVKSRTVSSLKDEDIFTLVRLENVDFIFKDGCYANVCENFSQTCDSWGTLLRSDNGQAILMHVNMLCPWRRKGRTVPNGVGSVTGIIDNCTNIRLGGNIGRYSIRPLDEDGIDFKGKSPWATLTGWVLDGKQEPSLFFEKIGYKTGLNKEGVFGDRILNDIGKEKGFLWAEGDTKVLIRYEFNSTNSSNGGLVGNSAIQFRNKANKWFNWDEKGKAVSCNPIYVEFSSARIKSAGAMTISIETYTGSKKDGVKYQLNDWCVQCSVDGGEWMPLKESASGDEVFPVRSLCWDNLKNAKNPMKPYHTPYENALGCMPKSFVFPKEAIGADKVLVRIAPATQRLQTMKDLPQTAQLSSKKVKSTTATTAYINFGSIIIDYK